MNSEIIPALHQSLPNDADNRSARLVPLDVASPFRPNVLRRQRVSDGGAVTDSVASAILKGVDGPSTGD